MLVRTIFAVALLALGIAPSASAAEVKVLAVPGVKVALNAIKARFERETGNTVSIRYEILPNQKQQVEGGDFDLTIFSSKDTNTLTEQGRLVPGSAAEFARVSIGVAVHQGAPRPDISTPEAVKQAILNAKSITFTRESATGLHMRKLIEQFGITDAVKDKIKAQPGGNMSAPAVGRGEVELGFVLVSDILASPGAELVAPLPDVLQNYLVEMAAIGAKAREPEAAKALIKMLIAPEARDAIAASGLTPSSK